jgi:hypothetical protein
MNTTASTIPSRIDLEFVTGIVTRAFLRSADGIRRALSDSSFQPPQDSHQDVQLELVLIWSA